MKTKTEWTNDNRKNKSQCRDEKQQRDAERQKQQFSIKIRKKEKNATDEWTILKEPGRGRDSAARGFFWLCESFANEECIRMH